jgi:uncharacterized protein YcbK (DUF882 family)
LLRRARWLIAAAGVAVLLTGAGSTRLTASRPETRTIALHNIHTDETVTVEYKRNGAYVAEAMKQIDWILRDWRKNETTSMDAALIDLLWEVHTELGSSVPINVISGYRSRATNDMLRRTVGGQASESRHILGKAADVQFPDVPLNLLRYSALVRERGGVGYYPTSATPFVHLDIDRVRAWPRLPRYELALLFPNGTTKHLPPDGDPITPQDVRNARQSHAELAQQLAEFQTLHKRARTPILLAQSDRARPQPSPQSQAGPRLAMLTGTPTEDQPNPAPLPKLVSAPRLADRPPHQAMRPAEIERNELSYLASLADVPQLVSGPAPASRPRRAGIEPGLQMASLGRESSIEAPPAPPGPTAPRDIEARFGWGSAWLRAPAYDDEHPEEDSYRPFPITPFLTESASPDDPAFVRANRSGARPTAKPGPMQQTAELLWAQQFNGEAAALNALRTVGLVRSAEARAFEKE